MQKIEAKEKMQSNRNEGLGIRFENRNGFLMLFFSGRRDNLSSAIKFWQSAIDERNKRAYKGLLV